MAHVLQDDQLGIVEVGRESRTCVASEFVIVDGEALTQLWEALGPDPETADHERVQGCTGASEASVAVPGGKPGRVRDPRDHEIEMLRGELARVTEAVKEQAIELSLVRAKSRWA